jgi:hypothetical protein
MSQDDFDYEMMKKKQRREEFVRLAEYEKQRKKMLLDNDHELEYASSRHTSDKEIKPTIRNRDSQIKIFIFKLGYVYGVDLNKVAQVMNVSSKTLHVSVGDPTRNIGSPDIGDVAYSDRIFRIFPKVQDGTIRVGIISMPIMNNYFSRVNGSNSILISLHQSDELCQKSGKTKEAYIAQGILARVLGLMYLDSFPKQDLYHDDTRGCIFDFCARKTEKVHKLRENMIDPICSGKLIEANVPESVLKTADKILQRLRKPSFMDILQDSFQKPLFSFIVGGLLVGVIVNASSSLILGEFDSSSDFIMSSILIGVAITIILVNYFITLKNLKKESPD